MIPENSADNRLEHVDLTPDNAELLAEYADHSSTRR
jgi:hypothetical protein